MLFFLLIFSFLVFSQQDTSGINPIFRDSILKNKVDSAKLNIIFKKMDVNKTAQKNIIIQKQKHSDVDIAFLYFFMVVLILLLFMRLLFDDFSFSLIEGVMNFKKYLLYYQSKKYDSLIAIILVYIISTVLLSLITYIVLVHFLNNDFTDFNVLLFLEILLVLALFFSLKNFLEYIFNWVIDTQLIFKAFFLQSLFVELILSFVILFILLIYVYNHNVSYAFVQYLAIFIALFYLVFNIIRSYQLMDSVRIPYKLHFFMYICAFKILPLLVLAKFILNNVIV